MRNVVALGISGLIIFGLVGCGEESMESSGNSISLKAAETTSKSDSSTTKDSATPGSSPEQKKLYNYIHEQKWIEAQQYINNNNLSSVKDLLMLKSYVEIRIEFADLSNSNEKIKLYEPILSKINKLNIDDYTGELKDQMTKFVEVFQKERNDYYDMASERADKEKKEKAISDAEAGIKEAINAIKNGDHNKASLAVSDRFNEESVAIWNYANALEEKVAGNEDMFFYYLEHIPTNYSGRMSKEILNLKLRYKTKEQWDQDAKDRAEILAQIEQDKINAQLIANAEAKKTNPYIGMPRSELENSKWGNPKDINKTITAYGTSEQWVYGNGNYVYLDDGIVTAIQN